MERCFIQCVLRECVTRRQIRINKTSTTILSERLSPLFSHNGMVLVCPGPSSSSEVIQRVNGRNNVHSQRFLNHFSAKQLQNMPKIHAALDCVQWTSEVHHGHHLGGVEEHEQHVWYKRHILQH